MIPNFSNPQLFKQALTHRSAVNEIKGTQSYERLEYLGDAVLELVVSDYLYHRYSHQPEGQLTHLRASIVQTKTLAEAAQRLKLGEKMLMSKGEARGGGSHNPSLLADCFEAVIGAIYLDQGFVPAKKFIHQHLLQHRSSLIKSAQITDYKSQLQELTQQKHKLTPRYKLVSAKGPDHHKLFTVKVYLNKKILGQGSGQSKQSAQQQAAKQALEKAKAI